MQIEEQRTGGVVVVALTGRVDSTTAGSVDAHLLALARAGEQRLVVDFAGVDYISSAGLRVMLTLARRIKDARGALVLCGMGEAVRQVFELAGFVPLFVIEPSREAAVTRAGSG